VFASILYYQHVETIWDKVQLCKLCSTVNRKPPQNNPQILDVHMCNDSKMVHITSTLMQMCHCADVKMEQNMYSIE